MEKGVPIRSISRCISVLQAINRAGSLSMMDIAQASAVPYPTACRIVQTLLHEGLIEREPARKHYRPTALVQTLSHGFQDDGFLVLSARPHLVELTKAFSWPASLTTHVGHRMVVRDSTHALTSLTFNNYYPGYTLPILECAAGQAYLAFTDAEERSDIIKTLRSMPENASSNTLDLFESGVLVDEIRRNGFATKGRNRYTNNPGKTSSIAAPILDDGRVVGAVTLVFFSSSIKLDDAINLFGEPINKAVKDIGQSLAESRQSQTEASPPARSRFASGGAFAASSMAGGAQGPNRPGHDLNPYLAQTG